MRQESGLPGRLTGFMEFAEKFHEKAVVQFFQILNAQTTSFMILTHTFPSYEAIGAVTLLFASPEEGMPFCIEQLSYSFRKQGGGHIVDRETPENSIHENESPPEISNLAFHRASSCQRS